jgi:hypothetical protein
MALGVPFYFYWSSRTPGAAPASGRAKVLNR